jgi:spore coat polysaccharide biosynthesis protein SpsF (cytidylyltransferase family)
MNINGITLIESVYRGAKSATSLDDVVVSIPSSPSDEVLFDYLVEKCIPVTRGSENDLMKRHIEAAGNYDAEIVVRIPGDNPLPHGTEIDRIVKFHLDENLDGFSTNLSNAKASGYPDGIGAEVFSLESLKIAYDHNPSATQKEHIHLNFFNYAKDIEVFPFKFPVKTPACPSQIARPDVILDINELADLQYFQTMFNDLGTNQPKIEQIIPWHDMIGWKIRESRRI